MRLISDLLASQGAGLVEITPGLRLPSQRPPRFREQQAEKLPGNSVGSDLQPNSVSIPATLRTALAWACLGRVSEHMSVAFLG